MRILVTGIAGFVDEIKCLIRHSRADGNPEKNEAKDWIPAFAGMTSRTSKSIIKTFITGLADSVGGNEGLIRRSRPRRG